MVVAEVKVHGGVPTLFIDHVPLFAMALCWPGKSEYVVNFAKAGLHLYAFDSDLGWIGSDRYDYSNIDRAVKMVLDGDPEGLILIRTHVTSPSWWDGEHPEELHTYDDGTKDGQSFASEVWKRMASEALINFIKHVRESSHGDHVFGYHLCAGISAEWQYRGAYTRRFGDYSRPMTNAFRQWLSAKYGGDVATLRRAWSDPEVKFENALIPTREERLKTDLYTFRDPSITRRVSDFYGFSDGVMADAAMHFCEEAKRTTNNESLAGIFYGYLMDNAWIPYSLQHVGHGALHRVLHCPHVDFLASPYAYYNRRLGGDCPPQFPGETLRHHGKLVFIEADVRTYLSPYTADWGDGGRADTLKETLEMLKRDFSRVMARGHGMWWGPGEWYNDPEIMALISKMKKVGDFSLKHDRAFTSGVAVIVDEDSQHYQTLSNNLTQPLIYLQKREWARIGTPYDVYLHDDLADPSMPEYRVYVFLNTFHLTKEEREVIKKSIRQSGKVAVWMYAPGFIDEEGLSVENIYDLTGMRITYEKAESDLHIRITDFEHPLTSGLPSYAMFGSDNTVGPVFYSDDPDAKVLGRLLYNRKPGLVVKEFRDWKSVYVAGPMVTPFFGPPYVCSAILRNIVKYAGVHIYSDLDDAVYANRGFLAVHTYHTATRTMRLLRRADVYDLFKETKIAENTAEFNEHIPGKSTALYRIEETS